MTVENYRGELDRLRQRCIELENEKEGGWETQLKAGYWDLLAKLPQSCSAHKEHHDIFVTTYNAGHKWIIKEDAYCTQPIQQVKAQGRTLQEALQNYWKQRND